MKQIPHDYIVIFKKIIADLSKDIRVVGNHIKQLKMAKHANVIIMNVSLNNNNFKKASEAQKEIKAYDQKIEQFDCVKKSLEASRAPYEYSVIRMRQLFAEEKEILSKNKHLYYHQLAGSIQNRLESISKEIDDLAVVL